MRATDVETIAFVRGLLATAAGSIAAANSRLTELIHPTKAQIVQLVVTAGPEEPIPQKEQ